MTDKPSFGGSLPGPQDIVRKVLPNNIILLVRMNSSSPSVSVGGYTQSGSLFDDEDKLGLANFVALGLLRGTQERDFQMIFDSLESRGASLGYSSSMHTTGFSGRALVEDLPLLIDVLADTLQRPTFPDEYVERLRSQLVTGLAIRAQDTAEMASLTFDQILYSGHPYRHPVDGWPETIENITRQDLVNFHQSNYGPKGMVVAFVGGVEVDSLIELVQKAFGDWQNENQSRQPTLPVLKVKPAETRHIEIPEKSQSDIAVGVMGPKRKDPDYISTSLANSILGQFGMMGRIGESVREKAGLAYYAYSRLNAGIGPGSWVVHAGINPRNVDQVIDLITTELIRFAQEGVSLDELQDSQANFIGRLPLSLESNAGVVNTLLNIERYDLGLDYLIRYPTLVQSVTAQDIMQVAQRYLQLEHGAIATAGTSKYL